MVLYKNLPQDATKRMRQYKIWRDKNINVRVKYCHNCGTQLELGTQKVNNDILYLYWICPGAFQDDACENNGKVEKEL
jgi:hypothetical protein